jgi:hypothetical protein
MLITGPPNDSQETAIPYDIDIHGNSLGIDATRDISGDSASRHICLSRPCSPSSTHSHNDVTFRAVQSIHLHQYLETVHSYTPPPSSVSSHPEYCTMSCTDGDPAESTAETENSDDGDRMVDEGEWEYPIPSEGKCDSLLCRRMMLIGRSDIPLDTMEIIVRRAVLLLKLTPENSYAYQELSEYTCLLGEASSRVSPEVESFRHSGHHCRGDTWRAMRQERSAVRRQYAQALLLFYRSDALCGIPIIHAMLLQKQMPSEGLPLFTIGSITNDAVLEDFRHVFTCHIWYEAIRWLALIVVAGKLPGNEVMGEEELRLKFWEMQLNDGGKSHL